MKTENVIEQLGLERIEHEGGWFKRIHTGKTGTDGRPLSTTIYALFSPEDFSALHRLDVVEQFFFLDGDPFEAFRISAGGVGRKETLGRNMEAGESPHLVFEPGEWFGGATVENGAFGWTLMSCVVTPGFEWGGFEIGKREDLLATYPDFSDEIRKLARS